MAFTILTNGYMSQRRMFSPDIVCSGEFLEMPASSRDLYFQLAMNSDDDGFANARLIMKTVGSSEDDLRVLLSKRFVLEFDKGVIVIKHWLIHNQIRKDRYKKTRFIDEKSMLRVKENGAYTEYSESGDNLLTLGCQNDNQMATQVRLGKVSNASEIRISATPSSKEIHQEEEEDEYSMSEVDEDGNDIVRKVRKSTKTNKSTIAIRIVQNFKERAIKIHPSIVIKEQVGYLLALSAIGSGLTEDQIYNLFDDWFSKGKDEDVISITAALSTNSINKFKVRENL